MRMTTEGVLARDSTPAIVAQLNPPRLSHGHLILALGFSADGARIISGSIDGTVSVWDAETGEETARIREGTVSSFESFAVGLKAWAAGISDRTVRIRSVLDHRELLSIATPDRNASSLAFSPGGQMLAAGMWGGAVHVWETSSGRLLRSFAGHDKRVSALAFSRDGRLIASVAENLCLWDLRSGEQVLATEGEEWVHLCVAMSPVEDLVAFGGNGLHVWDLQRRKTLLRKGGRTDGVAFTPDGMRLLFTGPSGLSIWDLRRREEVGSMGEDARAVAVSPDGRRCVFAKAGTMVVVDLRTTRTRERPYAIEGAVFLQDGKIASTCSDACLRFWDMAGANTAIMKGVKGTGIAVRYPGPIVAVYEEMCNDLNDNIAIWDLSKTAWGFSRKKPRLSVRGIWACFSPTEPILAAIAKCDLLLYDVSTGRLLRQLTGGDRSLECLTYSPDGGSLAAGSYDYHVRVWGPDFARPPRVLSGHTGTPVSLAFSDDGAVLASGAEDDTVRLWPTAGGAETTMEIGDWATSLVFASGDKLLLAGTLNGAIQVWDVTARRVVRQVDAHQWRVHRLSISPDKRHVVSSSYDGSAIVWSLAELTRGG